jgi:ketosteroid isomerase-like protein
VTDRAAITDWIERYERAWRTAGTTLLDDLFTADATYLPDPFDDSVEGLDAIRRFWEAEREGPDEPFTLSAEIVAVEGDTGVARLDVTYHEPRPATYRDLWIVVLDGDGRCRRFEEWPFFPGQPRVAER